MTLDFGLYFFGDYPRHATAADSYDALLAAAQHADRHGYSSVWIPERHFHSFGGIFPNPSVLAAAIAAATTRVRINAGSVVLPLHDPIRVAEEWSVVDNLSRGRIGIGCASGWNSRDFVFFPDRYGRHRELMYQQVAEVRQLWRGDAVPRVGGDGKPTTVSLYPRPIQPEPPMFVAVVGRPESYDAAARHDLGIVTNLMTQDVDQLAKNIARYRAARAAHGLDPDAGRVTVLLHTYLADDPAKAREEAYAPLVSYMRSSLTLFGQVTNSLGWNVDLSSATEEDLSYLFQRAYHRYCDARALIGSPDSCRPIVEALQDAGVDEIAALVDFGVPADRMLAGLRHLDALRDQVAATGAPLSPNQHRIWLADQLSPGNNSQNEPKAFRLRGPLDVAALRAAFDDLVARHEALRTVYQEDDGEPRQVVLAPRPAAFSVEDHTGADEASLVATVIGEESRRRFDLATGPLFVVRLLRLADTHHVLVLSMHHIAIDAVSARILTRDLSELYAAKVAGRPPALPALPRGPRDFARRQQRAARSPRAQADLEYWTQKLAGDLPVLALPEDHPRPPVQTFDGRAHFSVVSPETTTALRQLAADSRVTPFMVLVAGLAATLRHVTGDDDLIIGVPVSDRPEGSEDVVGFFVNTVPLRVDTSGDPHFAELLRRVRRTALEAYDHASVPFESVVRAIRPPRDTSRTPVFQVMAEYKHTEAFQLNLTGATVTPLDAGREVAFTDLAWHLINRGTEIAVHTEYHSGLFDAATITRIVDHFHAVLRDATADPERPLSALAARADHTTSAAPPQEWQRGTTTADPDTTIPRLIAENAAADPDALAVTDGTSSLRFGELETAANRRAHWLAAAGVTKGAVVAVWLRRSVDVVTTLLAIQKLGAAYLPLDPALGAARVATVLADSDARVIVCDGDPPPLPAGVSVRRLDPEAEADLPTEPPGPGPEPRDACYVIYTSGSTGSPKGVVVPHRAVVNLCHWMHRRFAFGPSDRAAVVCGQSFDASVLEIWPALTAGAGLAIADEHTRLDPVALARWFREAGVTFTLLPTALGEAVMELPLADQPRLKTLMVGGDVLRRRPPAGAPYETVNAYGPTEATVLVTTARVSPDSTGPIPIGTPIDNTVLLVLDERRRPVPVGTVGELYIGGRCLADGYLHAGDLTAQRFVHVEGYGRLYRTGDVVRWTPSGELEFRGRIDDQVKIRGYRVEPAEATRALREVSGVRDGVVLALRDREGDAYLAGYVVGGPDGPADLAGHAQRELLKVLPEYLVPRVWATLDALPRDVNGKLDRRALPTPTPTGGGDTSGGDVTSDHQSTVDQLRSLWTEVLGVRADQIGPDTSFFDLGGHSIAAMKLLSRLRQRFGVTYPTLQLYQDPSFAGMVARLTAHDTQPGAHDATAEEPVLAEGEISYQQFHMVSAASVRPAGSFNISLHVDLVGNLRVDALRAAIDAVTERHHSLRTRFVERDGRFLQQVLPHRPMELAVLDLRTAEDPEEQATTVAVEVADEPFDVTAGRLLRTRLLRLADDRWRLLLVTHHAVCDGWSAAVLLRDLAEAYRLAYAERPAVLPPATQSIDYARWQLAHETPTDHGERIAYWRKRLADTRFMVGFPSDRPAPDQHTAPAISVRRPVPADLSEAIARLARDRRATAFAVWAAGLGVLVAEQTGIERMALGAAHAAREHPDHDSVVAGIARVSILAVHADPTLRFGDLVTRTMHGYAEGLDHFVPLVPLLAALAEDRGDEIPTVMPVSLTYQSSADVDLDLPDLEVTVTDVPHPGPRARTTIVVEPRRSGTMCAVVCSGDQYDAATADGWLTRLLRILTDGTSSPDTTVAEISRRR